MEPSVAIKALMQDVADTLAPLDSIYAADPTTSGYYVAGLMAEALRIMIHHWGDSDAINMMSEMINGYMKGWNKVKDL